MASPESCLLPAETRDLSEDDMVLTSGFRSFTDAPHAGGGNHSMSTAYLIRCGGLVFENEDPSGDR
jgi:hypothetical protein